MRDVNHSREVAAIGLSNAGLGLKGIGRVQTGHSGLFGGSGIVTLKHAVTGLLAGGILSGALVESAYADHRRHWFFDSYGRFEADVYPPGYVPRGWFGRRPVIVYDGPEYLDDEEYLIEEDYAEPRRQKRRNRWRERRVRYDLAPRNEKLRARLKKQRRQQIVNVPTPREKPYLADDIMTSSLNPVTRPAPATLQAPVEQQAALSAASVDRRPERSSESAGKQTDRISCRKATEIVEGFGFTDIEARKCTGSSYDFAAKRDGKPFTIRLSAANGELTEVTRN